MHKDIMIKCQCENKLTGRYSNWFIEDNCKFVYIYYEDDSYGFRSILYRVSNDYALYSNNNTNSIVLWVFDLETRMFKSNNKYLYTFNMKEFGTFPIKELIPIMELVEKNLEFI